MWSTHGACLKSAVVRKRKGNMVATADLRATQDGVIWPRRPLVSPKGLLSCLQNLPYSSYDKSATRFRAVTFNSTGEVLVATDEKGRVFAFFVTNNRYALVQHLGVPTVASAFSPVRKTELLITCENDTIRCIDVQSQSLISTLRGHRFPAQSVSFQQSGKLALTASQDAVILWDTKDWSRYRVLNAGPGVEEASFVSRGDLVAVCFQDDSIMIWELESLALRYRFSLPEHEEPAGFRKITVSDDYKMLVATGRSRFVYVWDFESQTIIRVIELPTPIEEVVTHSFVPGHSSTLCILGSDGSLFFLNAAAKKPKIKLEISNPGRRIVNFDIECHGRYLAVSTDDGCLLLYDLDIARETASRTQAFRRQNGLVELEESRHLKTRTGILKDQRIDEVSARRNDGAVQTDHPVSSKLIDNIFGSKKKKDVGYNEARCPASADAARPKETTTKAFLSPASHQLPRDSPSKFQSQKPKQRSVFTVATLSEAEISVNQKRLEGSLRAHGAYPSKYRVLVWRFLLRLPKNEVAFRALMTKGPHPVYMKLGEEYPLQNRRLSRRLHRVLSCIAYWCPAFGEVTHLPAIVYPMIKIFRENDLAAFEASLCVLLHWCREFLSSLPYPPVFVLSTLETKLEHLDPQLHDHFVKHNVGAELYAWSLLKTIFTEVLSEDEWVCLWDHLFTYPDKPWMLQVAVLAYLSYFRTALLGARDRFSIEQFFHQQNAIKIQSFIQLLVNLSDKIKLDTTNESNQDEENTTAYWPMPKGQYPAFANFPRFIVDFQISERNRIALEEAEMLQKKKLLAQAEREGENLKAEHHKWLKQREALLLAEEKRRTEALEAEKHRILSLRSLDHETRKRRLERLALLEKAAQETLEKSAQLFQAEYHRLDSELAITKERTEFEISSRQQEEELQRLEFETERRVQGIHRQREMDERLQQIRSEFLTQLKQNELQDLMAIESWKRDDEVQRAKAKVGMERKEKLALLQQEKAVRQQLQNKLLDHMMSKEQELQELRTHRDSRMTEERAYEDIDHHLRVHEQSPPETRDVRGFHPPNDRVDRSAPRGGADRQSTPVNQRTRETQRSRESSARSSKSSDQAKQASSAPTNHHVQEVTIHDGREDQEDEAHNSVEESLRMLDDARRRLSSVLSQPLAQSSSSESSLSSAAIARTKEELSRLEKALGDISSGSSSDASSHRSSTSSIRRRDLFQGISPINPARSERMRPVISAEYDRDGEQEIVLNPPPAIRRETLQQHTQDPPQRGTSIAHNEIPSMGLDHSDDEFSSLDEEGSSLLQRPLEELERELGINFNDLSEEEKDDDSDDEELEDDRAQLLLRAKKLLAEQSLLSDDSDDEGHGYESQPS